MRLRRASAVLGMLTLGFIVLAGCEPAPPPGPPAVRGLRFEIATGGPFVIGADVNDDPVPLTNTPPAIQVAAEDDDCAPIGQNGSFATHKETIDIGGTSYEAWFIDSGSQSVIVPGDPKCLPNEFGDNYAIIGLADTLHNDGPVGGKAPGFVLDERSTDPGDPSYRVIK